MQGGPLHKVVQQLGRLINSIVVGSVDYVDNGLHVAAVALPHAAEAWLATNIPKFDGDIPFSDLAHVEANLQHDAVLASPCRCCAQFNRHACIRHNLVSNLACTNDALPASGSTDDVCCNAGVNPFGVHIGSVCVSAQL